MPGDVNVDLGNFSKPATVLIEKISDAVGGLCKPFQIVREAKANAKADLIKAESQIEISGLQRMAFDRFLNEEAKRQNNMEDIIKQALPDVNEKATPEKIDDDWIINFFDKCRLISDSQMQSLWSRILAGEANSPNTFSKRTVNCLSSLDKLDAELFTKLCIFCWQVGDFVPLIYDFQHEIYNKHGINFDTLNHLDSIGLVKFQYPTSLLLLEIPKKLDVYYHGKQTRLEFTKDSENEFRQGNVTLTKIGRELIDICTSSPSDDFYEYILGKWKEMGYIKEKNTNEDNAN